MAGAFIASIICAVIGGIIGERKGRAGLGALLGFFLALIGVLIIAVMGPTEERKALDAKDVADRLLGAGAANDVETPASDAARAA